MIVPTLSSLVLYSPTQHFLISVNKSKRVVLNSMSKPVLVDRRNCGVIGAQTFLRHFFVAKKWHEHKLCISPDSFRLFSTDPISSAFVTIHKAMLREIKVYTEQRPSDRRYVLIQFAGVT